jgi:Mrp family chromosome partitioning ATPase/capsular polysaccharide biosynthesis protein
MVWRDAVQSLLRRRWLILFCLVLGVGGAFAYALPQHERWTASSEMVVGPAVPPGLVAELPTGQDKTGPLGLDLPAETQARIASSPTMMKLVAEKLKLPTTPAALRDLAEASRVRAVTDNSYVITADGPTAEEAVRRANQIATTYLDYREETTTGLLDKLARQADQRAVTASAQAASLQGAILDFTRSNSPQVVASLRDRQIQLKVAAGEARDQAKAYRAAAASAGSNSQLVTPASTGAATVSPNLGRDVVVGAALGLLLGIGLALAGAHLSPFVTTRDEAARSAGAPVLTATPAGRRRWPFGDAVVPTADLAKLGAETAAAIARRGYSRDGRGAVLVASASANPNAEKVATAVAECSALNGRSTVLVFADVEGSYPQLAEGFRDGSPVEGLLDLVMQPASVRSDGVRKLLQRGSVPDLWVLFPGLGEPRAAAMVPAVVPGVVADLRKNADVVVVHGPAADRDHDASPLAAAARGTVLVLHCGRDRLNRVSRLAGALRYAGAPVLGVVLIGADSNDDTLGLPGDDAS